MKTLLLHTSLALFLTTSIVAAESIVTVSSGIGGRYLMDITDAPVANGSLVWVGTFDDVEAISLMPIAELQTQAKWRFFGQTQVMSIGGNPGKISGDVINNEADADTFIGDQIYLWVFNALTIDTSTGYGIFTASGGDFLWSFPPQSPEGLATVSLNDSMLEALVGSVDGNIMHLSATPIPEPLTYAMGLGLASLFALACRRHHG